LIDFALFAVFVALFHFLPESYRSHRIKQRINQSPIADASYGVTRI
jgi:hypothetical protein